MNWSAINSDLIRGLPAAFVAFVIGAIAARIAYNQYLVAKAKLSLDLFEKRFPIFQKTWEIVSDVGFKGKVVMFNLATPFNNFRPQARFLFGKDIEEYLDMLSCKYIDLETFATETEGLAGEDRIENLRNISALKNWFHEEASHGVKDKFGPYLDFERWK